MKETDLQSKACVVPIAIVAGLGMAGMGLVSGGIVAADTVTDTLNIEVPLSCAFNSVTDKTYTGSAANGAEVNNFNDQGIHEFNIFCNDNNGFIVTATPYDLTTTGTQDLIAYTANYTPSGVNGLWTAAITSDTPGVTVVPVVPVGGGTIISFNTGTTLAGVDFTATYSAYVGTATPAGTYTGTIVYTLIASGASNSGSNTNTGTDDDENGGGSENSGQGESETGGSGTGGSGTGGDASPSNTNPSGSNNTPNSAPTMLSNTYNSYSTTNHYNTTNYPSSGTGTTGTQVATTGNTDNATDGTTGEDNNSKNNSKTSDGYENPLGVTTNTSSSSDKDSGIDWAPIVATGVILAAAGAGAVALARSNKEDEQEG